MRKTLLILTLALMSSLTVMADYNFKFCGSLSTATGLNYYKGQQMRVSLEIPADMANQLAGNQITEIHFGLGTQDYFTVPSTVFVMEDGKYVCTGNTEDATEGGAGLIHAAVALETPYTIKENTPFTFGYIMDDPISGLYPLGLSQSGPEMFAGKVEILEDGTVLGEVPNIAVATGGYTGFLYAASMGDKDALLNYVLIEPDGLLLPTVDAGSTSTVTVKVLNLSSRFINPIKFEVDVNGVTTEYEYTRRLSAGASKVLSIETPAIPEGRNDISVKVVQTSGETPANQASFTSPVIGLAPGEGFPQKVVVEEGTGTWCGYCPRGIVGMDYMAQEYPDNFIGICVHGGGNDPFITDSYSGIDKFFTGYPTSVTNRQPGYVGDPSQANLENIYKVVVANNSAAQISLEVVKRDNELYAVSTTDFAFDHFCAEGYKVAFVIIENGLVGAQTNYYSGQSGSLEWWDTQRSTVVWTYSDTARDIFDFNGLDDSLICDQVTTQPYRFQATLPLTNVKNVANTAVIALLLDDETGVIMNASRVYYDDYKSAEETGVSDVLLDQEVQTIGYYTLSGQKVENPQRGQLYIEALSNGNALKRIFK